MVRLRLWFLIRLRSFRLPCRRNGGLRTGYFSANGPEHFSDGVHIDTDGFRCLAVDHSNPLCQHLYRQFIDSSALNEDFRSQIRCCDSKLLAVGAISQTLTLIVSLRFATLSEA